MNNISNYIQEKLVINKNIKNLEYDYWFEDMLNANKILIDDYYNYRKLKNKKNEYGELKNRPWYAVVLFLLDKGPTKVADIRPVLWPGKTSQRAELFTAMRNLNIIKSNKGYQELQPYDEWHKFDTSAVTKYWVEKL